MAVPFFVELSLLVHVAWNAISLSAQPPFSYPVSIRLCSPFELAAGFQTAQVGPSMARPRARSSLPAIIRGTRLGVGSYQTSSHDRFKKEFPIQ